MKGSHWIAVGVLALLLGTVSFMEIVDTTDPEILYTYETETGPKPLEASMHPQGKHNYTEVTYVYVLVRDRESGISRVLWNWWQENTPPDQVVLNYAGFCYYHRTLTTDEWDWHWGEPFPEDSGPFGGTYYLWQIWAFNLTQYREAWGISDHSITEGGTYSFWFTVTSGSNMQAEPVGMANTFTIASLSEGGEEEQDLPGNDTWDNGNGTNGYDTNGNGNGDGGNGHQDEWATTDYLALPLVFFGLGIMAIVYGFSRQKQKGSMK